MTNPFSVSARSSQIPSNPALIDDLHANQSQPGADAVRGDAAAVNHQPAAEIDTDIVTTPPNVFADRLQSLTEIASRNDVKLPNVDTVHQELQAFSDNNLPVGLDLFYFEEDTTQIRVGLEKICKMTASDVMAIIKDENSEAAKIYNKLEEDFADLETLLISLINNPRTSTPAMERLQEDFSLIQAQLRSVMTQCWSEAVDKDTVIQQLLNKQNMQMSNSAKVFEVMEGGVKPILDRIEVAAGDGKKGVAVAALLHEADQAIAALRDIKANGVQLPGSTGRLMPMQSDVDRLVSLLEGAKARLQEQSKAAIGQGLKSATNRLLFTKEMGASGSEAAKDWLRNTDAGGILLDFLDRCAPALSEKDLLNKASTHARHGIFLQVSSKSELIHHIKDAQKRNFDALTEFAESMELVVDIEGGLKKALSTMVEELQNSVGEMGMGWNPLGGNTSQDWLNLSDEDQKWIKDLLSTVSTICKLSLNERQTKVELDRVNQMCDAYVGKAPNQIRAEDYKALLNGTLDFGTVSIAYAYGLNGVHLDTSVRPADITDVRYLGSGGLNTVKLVTYSNTNPQTGKVETKKRVFKPAIESQLGFSILKAGTKGRYSDTQRTIETNIASDYAAKQLGVGNVMAKSSFGVVEGVPGILMEQAPGDAAYNVGRNKDFKQDFLNLPLADKIKMRGETMRKLNQLHWTDLLCGQMDRHSNNYLVNLDFQNKTVTVSGIDNDLSFNHRMVGMRTFCLDVKEFKTLYPGQNPSGKTPIPGVKTGKDADNNDVVYCNMDQMTPAMRNELISHCGGHAMCLPTTIDASLRERLLAINEEDYRKDMMAILQDEKSVNAAVSRLKDAQQYVRDMPADRIIDDWENKDTQERILQVQNNRVNELTDPNNATLKNRVTEYFYRDMIIMRSLNP